MKNRTGYIYRRGNIWWLKYCINKREFRESLETTEKTVAEAERKRRMYPLIQGDMNQLIDSLRDRADKIEQETFTDIRNSTLKHLWPLYLKSQRRPDSGPATLRHYEQQWGKFALWCDSKGIRTNNIAPIVAERYMTELNEEGLTGSTWNKHLNCLKLVWRIVCQPAGLPNPFLEIIRKRQLSVHYRPFTDKELNLIARKARGDIGLLFAIGRFTGLRLADCVQLQWNQIDLKRKIITLVPQKVKRRVEKEIYVPIIQPLYETFTRIKHQTGYLLPILVDKYKKDSPAISKRISKFLDSLKITDNSQGIVGFHCLRHSYATTCREYGIPEIVVQAILGHTSTAMTRAYVHVDRATVERALQ